MFNIICVISMLLIYLNSLLCPVSKLLVSHLIFSRILDRRAAFYLIIHRMYVVEF